MTLISQLQRWDRFQLEQPGTAQCWAGKVVAAAAVRGGQRAGSSRIPRWPGKAGHYSLHTLLQADAAGAGHHMQVHGMLVGRTVGIHRVEEAAIHTEVLDNSSPSFRGSQ